MNYFSIDIPLSLKNETVLSKESSHHLLVRRVRSGENVVVQDPNTQRFEATIKTVSRNTVTIIPQTVRALPEPPTRTVILIAALTAEQALDTTLQKATELGVESIALFRAARSPHLKKERLMHKQHRWNEILISACEQSGRPIPPKLTLYDTLEEALAAHTSFPLLLADREGGALTPSPTMALVVGPEGGFTPEEKKFISARNAHTFSLGPYMLRAETAAIAGLARAFA